MSVSAALSVAVTLVSLLLIWKAPQFLERRKFRAEAFARSCAAFYDSAWPLLKDPRTPVEVLLILKSMNRSLNDGWLIPRVLFRAARGDLREHMLHPPPAARRLLRATRDMPVELRKHLNLAGAHSLEANALRSGWLGTMFLRLVLPNPTGQPETALNVAAEGIRVPRAA